MPSYYPRRGKAKEAISLWKETLEKPLDIEIAHSDMNGAYPTNPDLRDEVLSVIGVNGGPTDYQKEYAKVSKKNRNESVRRQTMLMTVSHQTRAFSNEYADRKWCTSISVG